MPGKQAEIEVVAIGNELLLGETVDTNGAWLGRRLAQAGIRVVRRSTVGDVASEIRGAVEDALARTGGVICSGGLGPTRDDITRPVVAELFGRALNVDEGLLERVRERFRRRGLDMPSSNVSQAEVPEGALVFTNPRGTAPGLCLEDERGFAILLPGIPAELKALIDTSVLEWLLARFPERAGPILNRQVRTNGLAESVLAEKIDDIVTTLDPLTVAFLPDAHGVDLRITSWGALGEAEARARLDDAVGRLAERLAPWVYALDDQDMVDAVHTRMVARGLKLALAESCTGGLIAKRLTDRAGASDYVVAGIMSYANEAKVALLGVRPETLAAHGAVSAETAREMVDGVRRRTGADAAIAVTGVAGPTGGSAEKPVGTVWIGVALGDRVEVAHHRLLGDRLEIRERASQAALGALLGLLREGTP